MSRRLHKPGETPEKTIVRNVLARYKRLWSGGLAWFVKYHGSRFGKKGTPDLLCCVRGRFVGIELKTSRGIVSPMQHGQLKAIARSGGIALVACTPDEVQRIVDRIIIADERCTAGGCKCHCHEKGEVIYERDRFKIEARRIVDSEGGEKSLGEILSGHQVEV